MADVPYRIIIGLEVHVQLLTHTKLFCGCSTEFGLPPNSATCPVCEGLPGSLPVMNRRAFELALKAALALNCRIAPFTKWDRKNYYYPDLPKNYQISQYDLPFSRDGWLEIETAAGRKRVGIIRVHLEEDAGKMLHDERGGGNDSLVDLNRAGTPLLEIVTEPDLRSPEEAKTFLEEIRLLMRELEVSDCEMQEGSLRCDANINIFVPIPPGERYYHTIVEVKNLNSFRAVERATRYEAEKQFEHLLIYEPFIDYLRSRGLTPQQLREEVVPVDPGILEQWAKIRMNEPKGTVGWDDARGETFEQRRKEEASDYRYFPEPDLVPVVVDAAWLERVRAGLGELPAAQRRRLEEEYGLSGYDAGVLTQQGRAFVAYFEQVAKLSGDAKAASNWMTNEVLKGLKETNTDIGHFPLTESQLAGLIQLIQSSGLNAQRAREVFNRMCELGGSAQESVDALGFQVVADEAKLVEIIRRAIAANPKAVADYKKGKVKAADAIKGAVMRETKGSANMELVQRLLLQELEKP
jgi:aspartyl-tRNA(Asn)/glutamyl-tRNA(Gln) amidotransferase subunit B